MYSIKSSTPVFHVQDQRLAINAEWRVLAAVPRILIKTNFHKSGERQVATASSLLSPLKLISILPCHVVEHARWSR